MPAGTDSPTGRPLTARRLAGLLLVLAGSVILLGIITAEATYPDTYTTHENEISDLGATRPPNSIIRQPSATIFNSTMMLAGALLLAATYLLHRGVGVRRVTISIGLLGLGVLGVGIFPGDKEVPHPIFALVAFVSGGVAAVLSARVQAAPARHASVLLGGVTLVSLVFALFGSSSSLYEELGDGGVERWIAYPVVLWAVLFGGYLMAPAAEEG